MTSFPNPWGLQACVAHFHPTTQRRDKDLSTPTENRAACVCHRADVLRELLEHLNVTAVCWRMTSPAWHAQTAVRIQHMSPWGFVFPNKHYMSEVIHQQPLFYVPTHPFNLNTPLGPWMTNTCVSYILKKIKKTTCKGVINVRKEQNKLRFRVNSATLL